MANEANLIPVTERTKDEARKISIKGGKASGESKRRKKSIRENMKELLAMAPSGDISGMGLDGIEPDELTNQFVMTAALMMRAQAGDVAAIKEIRAIIGEDERLKLDRERLELERAKAFPPAPSPKKHGGLPASLIAPAFAAANLDIANGVARPQIFAFDTENALINVTGTASFASEQLDLTIDPESKGIRIITLRSPLYVRGTFKNPQAGVKAGPLIARGAVAAALATLVTPAAALLALISPSEGEANQCRTILSQMKK